MIRYWRIFATLLPIFLFGKTGISQTSAPEDSNPSSEGEASDSIDSRSMLGSQLFFDADATQFSRDGTVQTFEGNVVAVGGGVLVTADKITLDSKAKIFTAAGHVVILTESQIFLGEKVDYHTENGDFLIVDASMIVNDKTKAKNISQKLLGFTPAEVAFEEQKVKRLEVLQNRKNLIKKQYLDEISEKGAEPSAELTDKYALLLEQEELNQKQANPFLAKMTTERRERYQKRRDFWEKSLALTSSMHPTARITAFFRIDGKELTRKNDNDFSASDAYWTPCKCDEDESPAWGFRASKINAQMEGYMDFFHPILEIKNIPVLYLPYLRVPLKEKRQSGLLPPTFAQRSSSGNIYSQPVFFDLGKDADATVTAEMFEKRGTKIALEGRYQQRSYSGWTLQVEGMRDRVWMLERERRRDAQRAYFGDGVVYTPENSGSANECNSGDPEADSQCKQAVKNKLKVPQNDWRGAQKWSGLSILAPRLSFVSKGAVYSDHRYVEDLTLYEDFESALASSSRATLFSPVRHRTHFDGKDFYVGAGGAFGDNVLTNNRYEGLQLPIQGVIQTRSYEFSNGLSPVPLYVSFAARDMHIRSYMGDSRERPEFLDGRSSLGDGVWQQFKAEQISPVFTGGIVKVDQFSDAEVRQISHENLSPNQSSISSWRTGLGFHLPMDGEMEISKGDDSSTKMLRHYMNWSTVFSLRPQVNRKGPYGDARAEVIKGDEYQETAELAYFATDRKEYVSSENEVDLNSTMITHRRVTFATDHTWDVFDKTWEKLNANITESTPKATETYLQRARRELLQTLDKPTGSVGDVFSEDRTKWYIDRYQLTEKNSSRFATLHSDVSYDFEEQKRRAYALDQRSRGFEEDTGQYGLPQPWSEVALSGTLSLFSSSIRNSSRYNIYYQRITKQDLQLALPSYFSTRLTLGLKTDDQPIYDEETSTLEFKLTRERYAQLSTGVVPNFQFNWWYGRRRTEVTAGGSSDPEQYQTIVGAEYLSPTDCWRLAFQRQKKYDLVEGEAEYLLQLSVIFLGQQRSSQNMSGGLVRELPNRSEEN